MKILMEKEGFRKMVLLLLPAVAGIAIALQTAMSGKLNREVGALETVVIVHFFGLVLGLIILMMQRGFNFSFVSQTSLSFVIAGSLGVLIIFSISKSFIENGALTTVLISVIIQLIIAKLVDHFGWFGVLKSPINTREVMALLIVAGGIFLYQSGK